MATDILDAIARLDAPLLYLVVLGLAFAETAIMADLIVPGEVGLLVASAAASEAGLPLVALWLCAAAGATLGDSVSFGAGRWLGPAVVRRSRWLSRGLGDELDRGLEVVHRHGGGAVFLGRFVGALRAVVPFVAGTARMSFGRFLVWNVAASMAWGGAVVVVGYEVGPAGARWFDRAGWAALAVVVAGLGLWWLTRRLLRRRRGTPSAPG